MPTSKAARAKAARKAATKAMDNRPWFDRARGDFFNPDAGRHTLLVTGEPTERINNFGNQTVDIPTNQGVFSTGSFQILRPLADLYRRKGKVKGSRLVMTVTGKGNAKRYENVSVQP